MPCHSPTSSLATLHQKIRGISYLYLYEVEASVDKQSAFHKQSFCVKALGVFVACYLFGIIFTNLCGQGRGWTLGWSN